MNHVFGLSTSRNINSVTIVGIGSAKVIVGIGSDDLRKVKRLY